MDIVHGKALPFAPPPLKHRGDGIEFKDLFRGTEGTPENYYLSLARQGVFYSPRHRHNFDQFRYVVRGDVSLAPDMTLLEGELSYHPEGVYYGPQHDVDGDRDVLVLQFGGASGQGYLSFDQLAHGQAALKATGRFEGGKYYAHDDGVDAAPGKDGFEALWEHHNGRSLVYPEPRFDRPVLLKPKNFAWKPADGGGKATSKLLGVFTERATKVQMLQIEAGGEFCINTTSAIQLLYVLRGEGSVTQLDENNTKPEAIEAASAVRLNPDSPSMLLSSPSHIEILHFVLPMLT